MPGRQLFAGQGAGLIDESAQVGAGRRRISGVVGVKRVPQFHRQAVCRTKGKSEAFHLLNKFLYALGWSRRWLGLYERGPVSRRFTVRGVEVDGKAGREFEDIYSLLPADRVSVFIPENNLPVVG